MQCSLNVECFRYYYRLLHHPRFYKRIHKLHHKWISPVSICAVDCHPFEYFLSNMLPLVMVITTKLIAINQFD